MFLPICLAEDCASCHKEIADNVSTSLHYTGDGMMKEWSRGAANAFNITMHELYEEKNCAQCHVTSCSDCHGLEPHENDISGNISTCDKCHLKKQSTFMGDMPKHKGPGPSADIHYEKGLVCTDCHKEAVHGDGTEYDTMLDAVKVTCEDCHTDEDKKVNNKSVTQYSTDIVSHYIHKDTLDCTACHVKWMATCVECHVDTMKAQEISTDKFYLLRSVDGKVKPFLQMKTVKDNETHTAYAEYFTHTITDEPHDCDFCHNNDSRYTDGEGQIIGPGGSFIVPESVNKEAYMIPEEAPGFAIIMGLIILLLAYWIIDLRN